MRIPVEGFLQEFYSLIKMLEKGCVGAIREVMLNHPVHKVTIARHTYRVIWRRCDGY